MDVIHKFKANEVIALSYSVIKPSGQNGADTVNHQVYQNIYQWLI